MKYFVSARFYVAADYEVEASSEEEALDKADRLFQEQDIPLPENLEIMDVCEKNSWSVDEIEELMNS